MFNTDGTVWLEVDNEGYVLEHYYDARGAETGIVNPAEDDADIFPTGSEDYADIYTGYFAANMGGYFAGRQDNPGVRTRIFYQEDCVLTFADLDKAAGAVKIYGQQGDGLGKVVAERE